MAGSDTSRSVYGRKRMPWRAPEAATTHRRAREWACDVSRGSRKEDRTMSLPSLVRAIEELLNEEDRVDRFASDRADMMVDVGILGVALTPSEIDEVFQADVRFLPAIAGVTTRRFD